MKGYWILFTHYYCPQCGRDQTYRERVTDKPRPATYDERHGIIESWDSCD